MDNFFQKLCNLDFFFFFDKQKLCNLDMYPKINKNICGHMLHYAVIEIGSSAVMLFLDKN